MKRVLSLLLTVSMCFSLCTSAFAVDYEEVSQRSTEGIVVLDPQSTVSYDELPDYIQEMVHTGDYVTMEVEDGTEHYYIVFAETVSSQSASPSVDPCTSMTASNGGTYTFSNPIISTSSGTTTYLLNVSYIPVKVVAGYLINSLDTSLMAAVKSLVLTEGAAAAMELVLTKVGISVPAVVITAMVSLTSWLINYAFYNSVKNAYIKYCEPYSTNTGGLFAETKYIHNNITTTGSIVTTFARWSNSTVNDTHYGKTGTWKAGVYYAGGMAIS